MREPEHDEAHQYMRRERKLMAKRRRQQKHGRSLFAIEHALNERRREKGNPRAIGTARHLGAWAGRQQYLKHVGSARMRRSRRRSDRIASERAGKRVRA